MVNKIVIVWLLSCFIIACRTPEQKLQRLIKKHPELVKVDTVWQIDTVIVKEVKKDTVFSLFESHDTVTIIKDKLTIKHFYNKHDSTVYLSGKCDTDTIIKEVPVQVHTVTPEKDITKWWLIAIILLIIYLIFRKK
jgi:hypothetical protein